MFIAGKQSEDADPRREFVQGERHMHNGDWAMALECFNRAVEEADARDSEINLYRSYQGLAMAHLNDRAGVALCRRAAAMETFDPEIFRNLARAELRFKNRKHACEAIKRGLRIDSNHSGLRELRQRMGVRRPPAIGFLNRDHLLNRLIGQLTYHPVRSRRVI